MYIKSTYAYFHSEILWSYAVRYGNILCSKIGPDVVDAPPDCDLQRYDLKNLQNCKIVHGYVFSYISLLYQ